MIDNKLTDAFADLEVSNVYVYVGDAVRDDFLPLSFTDQGTYVRTIAASPHSPASFASIVTGCYPPKHGVSSFDDRLPSDQERIFDLPDIDTCFLNSIFAYATKGHGKAIDPIHSVLDTEPSRGEDLFENLESPFLLMERGPGGHAPYGDFTGTAVDYFRERDGDRRTIVEDYERSIELDIEWFNHRLRELKERGFRENTLIVYTSDHGELLGEGGTLGHNDPMRPELVYVPTLFLHSNLPNGEVENTSFHHVDLLPTILEALGRHFDGDTFDGKTLPEAFADRPRPCLWRNRFLPDWLPLLSGELAYDGVWDSSGGRVQTRSSRLNRYSILAGKLFRSSKRSYMWQHLRECLSSYWWNSTEFGTPSFDKDEAKDVLRQAKKDERMGRKIDLSSDQEDHLRDLGYLS